MASSSSRSQKLYEKDEVKILLDDFRKIRDEKHKLKILWDQKYQHVQGIDELKIPLDLRKSSDEKDELKIPLDLRKISDEKHESEILWDQKYKHVQRIARHAFKIVKKYTNQNCMTEDECLLLGIIFQQKLEKKIQANIVVMQSLFDEDPELYRYRMISKEQELAFLRVLSFSINQVKFIDDLIQCDKLKYDSPPGIMAAVAKELFDKYPLETEQMAANLVKDRVCSLSVIRDAQRKFELQEWILSFDFISESSETSNDLKSLKKKEDFYKFNESEICDELRAYKRFLRRHQGNDKAQDLYMEYIRDTRDSITKRHERPYRYVNSTTYLAAQVVRGEYVIQDVRKEILTSRFQLRGH